MARVFVRPCIALAGWRTACRRAIPSREVAPMCLKFIKFTVVLSMCIILVQHCSALVTRNESEGSDSGSEAGVLALTADSHTTQKATSTGTSSTKAVPVPLIMSSLPATRSTMSASRTRTRSMGGSPTNPGITSTFNPSDPPVTGSSEGEDSATSGMWFVLGIVGLVCLVVIAIVVRKVAGVLEKRKLSEINRGTVGNDGSCKEEQSNFHAESMNKVYDPRYPDPSLAGIEKPAAVYDLRKATWSLIISPSTTPPARKLSDTALDKFGKHASDEITCATWVSRDCEEAYRIASFSSMGEMSNIGLPEDEAWKPPYAFLPRVPVLFEREVGVIGQGVQNPAERADFGSVNSARWVVFPDVERGQR